MAPSSIRSARRARRGRTATTRNGGLNGTPQPYLVADLCGRPKDEHAVHRGRLRQPARADRGRRDRQVHRSLRRVWTEPGGPTTTGADQGEGVGPWAADFREGADEAEVLPQPAALRESSATTASCTSAIAGTIACRSSRRRRSASRVANPNGEVGKCGFVGEIDVAPQTACGHLGHAEFLERSRAELPLCGRPDERHDLRDQPEELQEVDRIRQRRPPARQFHWPHDVAVDSEGNLYTGEVDGAADVQKFLRYGPAGCAGEGTAEVGKYPGIKKPSRQSFIQKSFTALCRRLIAPQVHQLFELHAGGLRVRSSCYFSGFFTASFVLSMALSIFSPAFSAGPFSRARTGRERD